MSIAKLKRISLVGLLAEKPSILDQLQALGVMHITPLHASAVEEEAGEPEVDPERLTVALRYLEGSQIKRRQILTERHFDVDEVVTQIERNRLQRLQLTERLDFLKKRIKELSVWGDFRLPESGELYDYRFWFYLIPNFKMGKLQGLALPWQQVHRDHRNSYVVVIAEQEPGAHLLPVPRTHTGPIALQQLLDEQEDNEVELEAVEAEREALTRWLFLLGRSIAGTQDRADRLKVSQQSLDVDQLFGLSGWVAERDLRALIHFSEQNNIALEWSDPETDEVPPTLLSNPELTAGGEDIVQFFQMPNYQSWDPSRVVFFSFAAFFALIMSDAGYALVMGGGVLFGWNKLAKTAPGRRLRALLSALTISSLAWGVIVGSYFGVAPQTGVLAELRLLDMNDFDSMMRISIFIGVGHLVLANLMMAWVRRHSTLAYASLGWASFILLALVGWLTSFNTVLWVLLAASLCVVVGFSSDEPVGVKRLLGGLNALTNVTKAFGDVLSYLRLFALGLASASLALTFNQLAMDVSAAVPGLGVVLAAFILVVGHGLNFVLTVVSGVIHGLRLNLIEFYNWSLADEGYPFQPFAKREVTPWTT